MLSSLLLMLSFLSFAILSNLSDMTQLKYCVKFDGMVELYFSHGSKIYTDNGVMKITVAGKKHFCFYLSDKNSNMT